MMGNYLFELVEEQLLVYLGCVFKVIMCWVVGVEFDLGFGFDEFGDFIGREEYIGFEWLVEEYVVVGV